VLFNGNPLLRYDGYYILADLLEIPNLAQRANRYWGYLVERHAFRVENLPDFDATPGERRWFLVYAPSAFIYRQFVMLAIALFIASEYLAVGIALATWSIFTGLVMPVGKSLWHVVASPRLQRYRAKSVGITAGAIAAAAVVLFFVPLPLHTTTEGVVWLPESATVRAGTGGFVRRLLVEHGRFVRAGEDLIESEDPLLRAQIEILGARVDELEMQLAAERFSDRVKAEITTTELRHARSELEHQQTRSARLVARSNAEGVFAVPKPQDLPGRFMTEGQTIAYVLPPGSRTVRATVRQDDIDLVRNRLRGVEIRLSERMDQILKVKVVREVPGGRHDLPSKALGGSGGGALPINPKDPNGTTTLQRVFQVDLELPADTAMPAAFGSRVYVRFEHDPEPLGWQVWRRLRQVLLSRLQA
jgi:putative peptide zinc metalloprotease protein